MLNLHLNGRFVQAVEVRRPGFNDFIAGQRQRLAHGHTIFISPDGIHQTARPGVVNLKLCVRDRGAGRPAVHGVVVFRGLRDLDLSGDGGILPLNLSDFSGLYVYSLELVVHNVALVLQLSQIEPARTGQIIDIDISPVIRGVLTNRLPIAIIKQENDTRDSLTVRVHLVDENTTDGLVGHSLTGDLSILHREIDGGSVQAERAGTVRFHRVVITGLQREIDLAVFPCGDGVHQCVIADLADLERRVRNPLRFVCRTDLGKFDAALRLIIKVEGLDLVALRDLNGLGGTVQNIARDCGDLLCRNGHAGGEAGDDHTALAIAHIAAIVRPYIGSSGVGHKEFHPGQRLVVLLTVVDVLLEDQRFLWIIVKIKVLAIIRVDHHSLALGFRVNRIAWYTLYLCRYDGACDPGEDDLALGIAPVQAVGGQLTILIPQE